MTEPAHRYDAKLANEIEPRWQERWEAEQTFRAPNPSGALAEPGHPRAGAPKKFVMDMFPYPSGAGLHVGHPLGYIGTDVYARYHRMCGANVMHTMGFDSFGLPAENAAIREGGHPREIVERNIAHIRTEMKRMGWVIDWDRETSAHEVEYYRGAMKHAALQGTYVINNPFWWSADDKFFNYALATKLGVAIPPTVLLPHKEHPTGTTERSMRNLRYPLDWESTFKFVGFPAFLKPFDGGGWRDVYKVNNRDEFFSAYDQTRTLCMTLQRAVNFREYFRCYVVGQEKVRIMQYDPRAPFHERYVRNAPALDGALQGDRERASDPAVLRVPVRPLGGVRRRADARVRLVQRDAGRGSRARVGARRGTGALPRIRHRRAGPRPAVPGDLRVPYRHHRRAQFDRASARPRRHSGVDRRVPRRQGRLGFNDIGY